MMHCFSHVARSLPWKRKTVMSEVARVSGGMLDLNPCGSSMQTNGRLWSRRKVRVLSVFFPFLSRYPLGNALAGVS